MPAESAVKALRQTNCRQRVDTKCCTGNCMQGRACPVHQACELPDLDDEDRASNKALLWGLAACAALVCLCVIFQPFFK